MSGKIQEGPYPIANMETWQKVFVLVYGVINAVIFSRGLYESDKKKNAFGITPVLVVLGIFVWGDAVVFGVFWAMVSFTVLLLNDWVLFLLIISIFWMVRSLGETIYWFLQQFSKVNRQPPERLPFYKYFHNDSIWFVHQIFCQCITVISIVFTLYFAKMWLK